MTSKKEEGLLSNSAYNCTFCSVFLQEESPRYHNVVRNAVVCPMSGNVLNVLAKSNYSLKSTLFFVPNLCVRISCTVHA